MNYTLTHVQIKCFNDLVKEYFSNHKITKSTKFEISCKSRKLVQKIFFSICLILYTFYGINVSTIITFFNLQICPVGKIAEKAVCRSVFLTIWHCLQTVSLAILPTGCVHHRKNKDSLSNVRSNVRDVCE